MPKLKGRLPKYRRHRPSGQAIVTLNSRDHYLGPHGSQTSIQEYDRLIAEWLSGGRQSPQVRADQSLTINRLILSFFEHVQSYYRKPDGTQTTEVDNFRQALRPLRRLYGHTPAMEFGPKSLKALREHMVGLGWCCKNVNKHVYRIGAAFKWAASEELLPASVYEQIKTVQALRRGRTTARESQRIPVVPVEMIEAVMPFLSRQVCDMIRLQLLCAARPGEIVTLKVKDIKAMDKIWAHEPDQHKTAHHDKDRHILFGPQAQEILSRYMAGRSPEDYLFSAAEAERERRLKLHEARRTPLSCGNNPGSNRRPAPKRQPNDCYTEDTYRRAIHRACDQAFPPPPHLAHQKVPGVRGHSRWETNAEWELRLGVEGWKELLAWQKSHRWSPNRLRKNAGTEIRRLFGLEASQLALGHSSAVVTDSVYAERDMNKMIDIFGKVG